MDSDNLGIVNSSVVPVSKKPDFSSEQVTQALLGESVRILERHDSWFFIEQWDNYRGWVNSVSLCEFSKAKYDIWERHSKFVFGSVNTEIFTEKDPHSERLRDAVIGTRLPLILRENGWVHIKLPDGVNGWTPDREWIFPSEATSETLIKTAFLFMGFPYLWGGKTPKGFDCSGFVQTVFLLNGIPLPRDSGQQYIKGKSIGSDWRKSLPGDLLFFGGEEDNVNHVGIHVRDGRFVHCWGFVRFASLNRHDPYYDENLKSRLLESRRIL
ncbi:MAG: NlpC/P60 family protein [Fidelibacterota bacterium]